MLSNIWIYFKQFYAWNYKWRLQRVLNSNNNSKSGHLLTSERSKATIVDPPNCCSLVTNEITECPFHLFVHIVCEI